MCQIDLTRYGAGVFNCRGTVQSQRSSGRRLLLLFGERHSLKPFIRDALLNVIELDRLGVLSCVGVEGHPGKEIPGSEARRVFESLQKGHGTDDTNLVEAMLRALRGRNYYFWKTLVLMRPDLKVESVDDAALCDRAATLEGLWGGPRYEYIRDRLRRSDLFEAAGVDPMPADWDLQIDAKVALQFEQEWGEHEVNVARDGKMLENLLALWDEADSEKVAVLNAGSSHQWRIARRLPDDISYIHIEQP
jgi:hypothetical protein